MLDHIQDYIGTALAFLGGIVIAMWRAFTLVYKLYCVESELKKEKEINEKRFTDNENKIHDLKLAYEKAEANFIRLEDRMFKKLTDIDNKIDLNMTFFHKSTKNES
jgi:hypothetical protein